MTTEPEALAAVLDRAELAWQRFFYPAADNFTGPIGDKLPSVDLEVADCLRLVLAEMGRHVVTPAKDIPALPTPAARMLAGEGEAVAFRYDCAATGEVKLRGGGERLEAHRIHEGWTETPLYAHPPAAEPVGLRAIDLQSLVRKIYIAEGLDRTKATQAERHAAQRLYEITRTDTQYVARRKALATPARTDDSGVGQSVQIIGGPCAHRWSAMTMTGHMSCIDCRQTRPMTATEVAQWTK